MEPKKTVGINKEGADLMVTGDPTTVFKTHTIQWTCNREEFTLTFVDGSPFEGHPDAGRVVIGHKEATQALTVRDVTKDPNYNQRKDKDGKITFKYDITCDGVTLDPEVIVDPAGP